jgi:hypothetical protein
MRMPVSVSGMFVGRFAVLQSCRRMLLSLLVLADRVMVLCLVVVMRGRMVVRGGVMMVLARGMFRGLCHRETPWRGPREALIHCREAPQDTSRSIASGESGQHQPRLPDFPGALSIEAAILQCNSRDQTVDDIWAPCSSPNSTITVVTIGTGSLPARPQSRRQWSRGSVRAGRDGVAVSIGMLLQVSTLHGAPTTDPGTTAQ